MDEPVACGTCGSVWSEGQHTPDCAECGGGALETPCVMCGGRCGAVWKRALLDSWDMHEAHWIGGCRLPPAELDALLKAR